MSGLMRRSTALPLTIIALVLLKLVVAKEKTLRDLVIPVSIHIPEVLEAELNVLEGYCNRRMLSCAGTQCYQGRDGGGCKSSHASGLCMVVPIWPWMEFRYVIVSLHTVHELRFHTVLGTFYISS
jgi:hypothetical protein